MIILFFSIFLLTGCTKYLKDSDKKAVKYEETGQTLTSNILCRPKNKEILSIYEEYNQKVSDNKKIDLENLTECENMKLFGSYEGLWTNLFVKPLAILIVKVGTLIKSYGLALIFITILIRAIVWPLSGKAAKQSQNMEKAKPELDKLERKYKNRTDQESMMQKSQEMLLIYKKYNINPMSGCLFAFIQIPLFLAFYEAISRIPVIFEETFLGFQLGTSPLNAVLSGHYYYLIFIVLIAGATYYSFKFNASNSISVEQEQQMKQMKIFMVVFMTVASFSISSGIAIYWVTSNLFTIFQNIIMKRGKNNAK
jgi:YidC/Oxa1 family membrane protein insertase